MRAGYLPWCVDLFADRDLRAIARVRQCPAQDYPHAMLGLLSDAPQAPVLFTGAMENHLELIEKIARQRPLLGSTPAAIRAAREPVTLTEMAVIPGLRQCSSWQAGQIPAGKREANRRLLLKPLAGAAGRGIDWWSGQADALVPVGHVVQDFIPGTPVSAVYTAANGQTCLLGATEQIIGDSSLGAREFQYAGSIGPLTLTAGQVAVLRHVGEAVVTRCGLHGIFGIDFIRDSEGDLWPIEINPRYPASAEVVEAVTGKSVLDQHLEPWDRSSTGPRQAWHGKAIVFARNPCTVCDLYRWFDPEQIADVPEPGERTPAHRPICTLLATGDSTLTCRRRLHDMAQELYTRLES